jgi:hypothetical protein
VTSTADPLVIRLATDADVEDLADMVEDFVGSAVVPALRHP